MQPLVWYVFNEWEEVVEHPPLGLVQHLPADDVADALLGFAAVPGEVLRRTHDLEIALHHLGDGVDFLHRAEVMIQLVPPVVKRLPHQVFGVHGRNVGWRKR